MAFNRCFENYIKEVMAKSEDIQDEAKLRAFVKRVQDKVKTRSNQILANELGPLPEGKGVYPLADRTRAQRQALEEVTQDLMDYRVRVAEQANAVNNIKRIINNAPVTGSARGELHNYMNNTWSQQKGLYASIVNNPLGDFIDKYKSRIPGIDVYVGANRAELDMIGEALHGDKVPSKMAMDFAKTISDIRNKILDEFDKLGIRINRLENYGLPHRWDPSLVNKVDKPTWVKEMYQSVDKKRAFNKDGKLMTDDQILNALNEDYDQIRTGVRTGVDHRAVAYVGRKAGSRHMKHRQWHFIDGKTSMAMLKKYGKSSNTYQLALEQIDSLLLDLSLAKKFGPNIDETFETALAEVKKVQGIQVANEGKVKGRGRGPVASLRSEWNALTGDIYTMEPDGSRAIADAVQGLNNIVAGVRLGSSLLTAQGDHATMQMAAKVWGMSYSQIIKDYTTQFMKGTASVIDEQFARDSAKGYTVAMQDALYGMGTRGRLEEMQSFGKFSHATKRIGETVIRAGGLANHTEAARFAFSKGLNSQVANLIKRFNFDGLPDGIRKTLESYEIDPHQWSVLKGYLKEDRGATFIDIGKLVNYDLDTTAKLMGMIHEETRLAVPESGLETIAISTLGARAGSGAQTIGRLVSNLKSFTISNTLNQLRRMFFDPKVINKTNYAVQLSLLGMFWGGVATDLKELANGKDLPDHTSYDFFVKSARNGFLGLGFGDIVLQLQGSDPIKQWGNYVSAPAALAISTIASGTGFIKDLFGDEAGEAIGKAVEDLSSIPGSNLWYTKLILRRLFWDQLAEMADPGKARDWQKYQRRMKSDTGQEYWWRPGQASPDRLPGVADNK